MDLHRYRQKNWQWRIIIWSTFFLIFGKDLGHWIYQALGVDQAYQATTQMAAKVGITDVMGQNQIPPPLVPSTIEIKNDTVLEYTIETKAASGHLDFVGNNLGAGESKRFTIKSDNLNPNATGEGELIFLSAPTIGANNTTCQEVHTLKYDIRQNKQPLVLNLSSINSKLDCRDNASR